MSPLAQILMTANRQPPAPPQTTVAPTNVAGIYANNDAQKMDAYKAQVAQQNAMYGGLASLGSAGIGALGKSGLLSSAGAATAPDISAGALSALSALGPAAII
jgi:hypothetical protein